MRIGELASKTGVTVRILRHYETKGLINSYRQSNGYRNYPPETEDRVRWIRDLLACGFSTREIRGFLPCMENEQKGPGHDWNRCAVKHMAKLRELDELINLLLERRRRLSERLVSLGLAVQERPVGEKDPQTLIARA